LSVVPVTTKGISDMTHDDSVFKYEGVEINQITIVGSIVHCEQKTMNVVYNLDDGLGNVMVNHWVSNDDNNGDDEKIYEIGNFVRVTAKVRLFQSKTSLTVLFIRKIDDTNEIITHILECMKFKKMMQKKTSSSGMVGGNKTSFMNDSSQGYEQASQNVNHGFDNIQKQVHELVAKTESPEGMGIPEIQRTLRGLNATQIRQAVDFLTNEGHIYSTINDQHFRITG